MWQSFLSQLVASGAHRTQQSLVCALAEANFDVNQSSVSRELSRQGVRKVGGYYVPRHVGGLPPGVAVHGAVSSVGGSLLILHTNPAEAPLLGQSVDRSRLPGVLGTIAGDDTVFVACAPSADMDVIRQFLGLHQIEGAA